MKADLAGWDYGVEERCRWIW